MDFNKIIERRGTNCEKWDLMSEIFGREDLLPFWVADMDFECPEEVKEALKKRVEHGILGYSYPGDRLIELIGERMKKKYGWSIEKEWIVFTPGVVPAMSLAIRTLTHPGDEVILQSPVYYPFSSSIENSGCHVVENELVLDKDKYRMDLEALNRCFEPKTGITPVERRVRAMLLCSPHNPVGRVWKREELEEAGGIVTDNGAFVVSDEIHCDIILKGRHIPFSSLPEFEQNSMVCMSGSKTFNLAGLSTSFAIIPNEEIRKRFVDMRRNLVPEPNILGLVALEAAFERCEHWLDDLLSYLRGNLELVERFFSKTKIKVIEPEGTYLVWLDFRAFGRSDSDIRSALVERLNIACPRTLLEDGLERIEKALEHLD
jgi:cystathionine beta-lyase